MARNLSSAELTHYASGRYSEMVFAELHFASGTLYLVEGPKPYTWGGHEWLALGDYGGISALEGSTDLGIRGFTLTLSGLEPGLAAAALDRSDYKGRDVIIHVGVLNDSGNLADTPKTRKRGFMDVAMASIDRGIGVIQMQCEAESMRLMMNNTHRFSDEDHQARFPGDRIFSLQAGLKDRDVVWGGTRVGGGGGGGDGGHFSDLTRIRQIPFIEFAGK